MYKVNFYLCLLVLITVILPTQIVQAAVYKWVDENGKVHFTDKPPKQLKQKPKVVNIKTRKTPSSTKFPRVDSKKPIKNISTASSRTILLERVSIDYRGSNEEENAIGKTFKYTRASKKKVEKLRQSDKAPPFSFPCELEGKLTVNNARYIFEKAELKKPFEEVIEENGYKISGKKMFAREQTSSNDLSLAAVTTDMRLMHCGSRSLSNQRTFTQNSTYMKVEWTLFDNLSRRIVYKTTTEGLDDSFKKSARYNGAAISAQLAFRQAVEHLLAQQKFVDFLLASSAIEVGYPDEGKGRHLNDIRIEQGDLNSDFVAKTGVIEKSAVTIRTAGGHGSGFVISSPGYILTNQHVIGENREVVVVLNGKELRASVLRTHPVRDVALLKLETSINTHPLHIDANPVKLGEEIYVVGTPLDEKLDFSITRGIISARRKMDNMNYYQTDAAVNPGNSGGPVFNKSGNVIGITVAGLFTNDGASKNINYLIPILDALDALKIKPNFKYE